MIKQEENDWVNLITFIAYLFKTEYGIWIIIIQHFWGNIK